MKKIALLLILAGLSINTFSQVFGTGKTLSRGTFSIGINPAYYAEGNGDLGIFFHGGYGLGSGMDLGLKAGFGWGDTYFGADFEKTLIRSGIDLSVAAGGHVWGGDFGLDGQLLLTIPIRPVYLTTGLDMDLNFYKWDEDRDGEKELHTRVPFWIPLSMEVFIKNNISLIFEAEIGLNESAYTYVGGGIAFYIK